MLSRPALFLLACAAGTAAFAQHNLSPALDESADRSARLLANAKREGSLSLYASMAEKDLIRLVSEFERRYGIKVKVWRSGKNYVFVQAYNTNRVKSGELPKTFRDLLDPRWKGRIAVEAKEQEWFFTLVREMGEENGLKFFRELVATNGLTVRNGNALLNNLVVAGEITLALTLYSYMPEKSTRRGALFDWFELQPTVAYTDGIGV